MWGRHLEDDDQRGDQKHADDRHDVTGADEERESEEEGGGAADEQLVDPARGAFGQRMSHVRTPFIPTQTRHEGKSHIRVYQGYQGY